MDQLFNSSQARGAQSAFIDLHRTVPYCMTIDERYGHRLFNRIQKQSPARKPSNHLRMSRRNQRTQSGVRELALWAQLYLAISSVRGGHQWRIGNTELQMRCGHEPNPLSHMTVAQCQIARCVVELFHRATPRAPLN